MQGLIWVLVALVVDSTSPLMSFSDQDGDLIQEIDPVMTLDTEVTQDTNVITSTPVTNGYVEPPSVLIPDIPKPEDYANIPKPEENVNTPKPEDYANVPKPEEYANVPKPEDYAIVPKPEDYANPPKPEDYAITSKPEDYAKPFMDVPEVIKPVEENNVQFKANASPAIGTIVIPEAPAPNLPPVGHPVVKIPTSYVPQGAKGNRKHHETARHRTSHSSSNRQYYRSSHNSYNYVY